jgi:hypothetical protein
MATSLDLLPAGALCIGLAMLPMRGLRGLRGPEGVVRGPERVRPIAVK